MPNKHVDVLIIGAGASGLICAIEAAKRGRQVLVLDSANKAGKKILMSGGGRCNFTNYDVGSEHYLSHNPHFCKSALSRYTQWDFIAQVEDYKIPYHEREHGQLFCNDSSKDILTMLLSECANYKVNIQLNCQIQQVHKQQSGGFELETSTGSYHCQSLVIASGGLSIPKMGASAFGYQVAKQFGHHIWPTQAGLVPFTLHNQDKATFYDLSGISVPCRASNNKISFQDNLLFTHRGLSGPAILQLSSYWQAGESIQINLLPNLDLAVWLKEKKAEQPNRSLKALLGKHLAKRLIVALLGLETADSPLQKLSYQRLDEISNQLQHWTIKPNNTEGYRTAEVTLGGVDCNEISSQTMASKKQPGLYFIGEVLDVTGWLGGYNFQWAWSSGWCAGQAV
ncbi:MAG: NAD(P)/FAD-dependent oxidoreductase [Cycloclasticus sp.]|nr:NAD(P)/FAD-dependent oxidoreductase [Cycloclasticus sp.]